MTDIIDIGRRLPQQTRKNIVERFAPDGAASYRIAVEAAPAADARDQNLGGALRQVWRRRWLVVLGTLAGGAIAAAVVWSIPPRYVGEVRLLVGIQTPRITDGEALVADISPDAERVQSEAFILQSHDIARQVISQLHLAQDPNFNSELQPASSLHIVERAMELLPPGLAEWLRSFGLGFSPPAPLTPEQRDNAMIARVLSSLDVSMLGRSHVLSIKAQAADPRIAAAIANAFARDYLEYQRLDKIETVDRVDKFLMDRVGELRDAVRQSDQAVEDYRRLYGLYKSGSTGSVASQQLTELNSQLMVAQAAKFQAAGRLKEAQELGGGSGLDSVPEVLQSSAITLLKQQLADSERHASEKAASLGALHPSMRDARAARDAISARVAAEVAQVVEGLKREARSTAARYDALLRDFERAKVEMGAVNDKSIQLDALERDAAVNRNLLQASLNRAKQTTGSADIMQANGKVISAAVAPGGPAFPPKTLLLVLGSLGGFLIAAFIAMLVERYDRTIRHADQAERLTGMPVLAMVPKVRGRLAVEQTLRHPVSPYSEALRRLFVSVELSEAAVSPRVIMVTSSVPAEGKSVIVASLGRQLAGSGKKVLLIDCDWRSPSLQRIFRCGNTKGLADLLTDENVLLNDCLSRDAQSGVDILPAGRWEPRLLPLLGSDRMARLLEAFSAEYDLLILDSPPVLVTADSLALCRLADKVLFVVRWGQTRQEAMLEALKQLLDAQADVAGIAISQVVTKKFRGYASRDLGYSRPVVATSP